MNTRRGGKCRFPRKRRAKGNMAVSRGFAKASGTVSRPPPPSPVRLRTPALHCKRAAQNKKRILQPPLPFRNANPSFEIPAETPREARAKRRPIICGKASFHTSFPSLSEISVPQRQAGFKQTAIPRHSAPTAAEREAKAPITTRCLYRTRCQIPALSQSVRARNTRNPLRIKAMPQPACNLR